MCVRSCAGPNSAEPRSDHGQPYEPVAPNLLPQAFAAEGPGQKWVCDVAHLRLPEG